ncbi:ATPase, AAA-type, core [Artemisia annua]|uniref:ATPase, AAA-type, core n=1 Tax=Artemisia annua TaxID=35608 RepID=A0A2U1N8D9_ARTAN|nr:ATPase, AAA-type, core [Artemisia annua]
MCSLVLALPIGLVLVTDYYTYCKPNTKALPIGLVLVTDYYTYCKPNTKALPIGLVLVTDYYTYCKPNTKLISLDMGSLVVGAKHRGEFKERLKAVLKEVNTSNGQIGIFINEIHKPDSGANDITHKAQGLTCFLNCTRITHKAQGVTCVAAKWNDFSIFRALEQAGNGLQYLFRSTTLNQKTKHEISLGVDIYNSKAFIKDTSATTKFTFFTPISDEVAGISCDDIQ